MGSSERISGYRLRDNTLTVENGTLYSIAIVTTSYTNTRPATGCAGFPRHSLEEAK
ncbi:protein of unknown function [Stenotrophomonas maltophilia]|nr:protein of unknown function [Stenotrophomonas maltophilia]